MKKIAFLAMTWLMATAVFGQEEASKPFRAYIFNEEYEVFMRIDFYEESITVPDQELYGQLPGYLGKKNNAFCWVITKATVKDDKTAELSLINDYGSEDLTARLTCVNDSVYQLRQLKGSSLKVPKNRRWQKLPGTLEFKRKK